LRAELFVEFGDGRRLTDSRHITRRIELGRLLFASPSGATPVVAGAESIRDHVEALALQGMPDAGGGRWEPLLQTLRREGSPITAADLEALPVRIETDPAALKLLEGMPGGTAQIVEGNA
jgi:hypothetical protein